MTGPLRRLRRIAARLRVGERAVVAVEMAVAAPVLVVLLLGALDVGWRILAEYKLQRAAATLADLVARDRQVTESGINDAFTALQSISAPFDLENDGRAIVSSIRDEDGVSPEILWQRLSPQGLDVDSRIGGEGEIADLDDVVDLNAGEAVIVAEVFYRFDPIVGFFIQDQQLLYFRWVATPRFGSLDEVLP